MYLKSLTLKGFKSFADRTVMRFDPGVAAVVGPNGSGKSNISDAVLWVLGELNAKNLRGQSMEDVIFSGSSARKPVAMAEVELLLDNSDGTLPIEYDEVTIGRRMYRSGESEYLINGTVMRRMDVLEILHDSGLGTGTHSIISQGNLDYVLSSKPEDRRALIEEAAGVLKHKERKRKSERKLQHMDAHLERVNDITAEVERQLKPLKRKAQRAISYKEVSAELSELRLQLAVDDLRRLQNTWNTTLERETALEAKLGELQTAVNEAQAHQDELQQQMNTRGDAELELNANVRRVDKFNESFNSTLRITSEKRRMALAEVERSSRILEENALKSRLAAQELESARAEYESMKAKSSAADAERDELERAYNKNVEERNELRRKIETLTAEERATLNRIDTAQASLEAMRNNLSESRAREQVLSAQLADSTARLEAAQATAAERRENYQKMNSTFEEVRTAEAAARENMNRTVLEREEARTALDDTREALSRAQAERAALEELERTSEQANPALSFLLDENSPAREVATPITHGFSAPPELYPIIEALLGHDMQAVMVRDTKAATDLIQQLKAAQLTGQAALIPQDATAGMVGPEGYEALLSEMEVFSPFEQVIYALLGDVYLAPNLADALQARQNNPQAVRYATLDGYVVEPSGKILYLNQGEEDRANSALLRRRLLEEARGREEECKQAYERATKNDEVVEQALRGLQSETLRFSEQLAQLKGQAESAKQDADNATEVIVALQTEHDRLQAEYTTNQATLEKAAPSSENLSQELVELQAALAKNRDEVAALSESLEPLEQAIVEQGEELSKARLNAARLAEGCSYAQRMVATREGEIRSAARADTEATQRAEIQRVVAKRVDPLNDTLRRLMEQTTVLLARLEDESQVALSFARTLREGIAQATSATREAHKNLDEATAQMSDLRVEKGQLEVKVEAAVRAVTEDCDTSLETAQQLPQLENRFEAEQQAASLERRIRNMGTINPDAAREYEEVNERYTYLMAQLADLNSARKALSTIVEVIDERMREDFINTFNQVNDNFAEIFQILFPGGRANLSLVDPDDLENTGVDVNAQPAGKRVRKMSLLSGGEKSLTALALLFAVYRIRQTPFYILDEVEAALDDSNLRRLLAYLGTIRANMQFIMITHQRRTMEMADVLYGVSMQADGVTKVISQKLADAVSQAVDAPSAAPGAPGAEG